MTTSQIRDLRKRTLQEWCTAFVKERISLYVSCLHELPAVLVQELAISLPPSQLLELEKHFKDDVTEAGWEYQCQKRPHLLKEYRIKKQSRNHFTTAFNKEVTSYRDVWLKFYVSQYLLLHFSTWVPECTETHARPFLFSAKDQETMELYPPWTFNDFVQHTVDMIKNVKEISIRSRTLRHLIKHPEVIEAFKDHVTVLTVDLCRDCDFTVFLKVLQKLIFTGRLKCLKFVDAKLSSDSWDLLFFICSGLFHCKQCAVWFSTGMKDSSNAMATSLQLQYKLLTELHCDRKQAHSSHQASNGQACRQNGTLEFDTSSHGSDIEVIEHSDCDQRHIDLAAAAHTSAVGCTTNLYSQLPSRVFDILNEIGYPGLAGYNFKPEVSVASGLKHSSHTLYDDLLCTSGLNNLESRTTAVTSECRKSLEDCCASSVHGEDLMDEALGVSADRGCPAASSSKSKLEAEVAVYDETFAKLTAKMHLHHLTSEHKVSGLWALVLYPLLLPSLRGGSVRLQHMLPALAISLDVWASLSTLCLALWPSMDLKALSVSLVKKIRQSTLKVLSLDILLEHWSLEELDDSWFRSRLQELFWEILHMLASRTCSSQNPMDQLKISSAKAVTFSTKSLDFSERDYFQGLQMLSLTNVAFDGPETFHCLMQYFRQDQALHHISLRVARLDNSMADLLLSCLVTKVEYLECVDLGGSLRGISDTQWNQLCSLLSNCPSIMFLGLSYCQLTNKQVQSEEFLTAVKMHSTVRKLTLDLSYNGIGDGLAVFLPAVICPSSSLKELHIAGTSLTVQQGMEAFCRIEQNSTVLPLLQYICIGSCRDIGSNLYNVVQKIAKQVEIVDGSMRCEHLALM